VADIHPEVLKEIEAGPQEVPIVAYREGTGFPTKRETPEEFARRISALQQELEREECAKVCESHSFSRPISWWMNSEKREVSKVSAQECAAAIRRRGKP